MSKNLCVRADRPREPDGCSATRHASGPGLGPRARKGEAFREALGRAPSGGAAPPPQPPKRPAQSSSARRPAQSPSAQGSSTQRPAPGSSPGSLGPEAPAGRPGAPPTLGEVGNPGGGLPGRALPRGLRELREHSPELLAPFQPPPPILSPVATPMGSLPVAGGGTERAQAAALAEKLLASMRVGRVGAAGHEVRLRLTARRGREGIEVRLREEDGMLRAQLLAGPGERASAERLAEAVEAELHARGLHLDSLEVEIG